MTAFNNMDKDFYSKMAGALIKGDPDLKKGYDEAIKIVLGAMKKAMPLATDEMLAEFSSAISMVMAQVMRSPMQSASEVLQTVFNEYAMVTAQLIGAYNVESSEVPNVSAEDVLKTMTSEAQRAEGSTARAKLESDDYGFGQYI